MSSNITITLPSERSDPVIAKDRKINNKIFTPGELVSCQAGSVRGHGAYASSDKEEELFASVAGIEERINRLISVKPLKQRYCGDVGDVVVARVTQVQTKRWKLDANARLDALLPISSVNLPGGELRRRSLEDQHMMRKYLVEGDLISAEVQCIQSDGSLSLHTRSLKYGKLSQGVLVVVFPGLIKRCKTHFHTLPCGDTNVSVITGNNGYIWISTEASMEYLASSGGFTQNLEYAVDKSDREVIARVRNCILALAAAKIELYDTSISNAFNESLKYSVSELLKNDVIREIAFLTNQRLMMM